MKAPLKKIQSNYISSTCKNLYDDAMDTALQLGTPSIQDPDINGSTRNKRKRGPYMGLENGEARTLIASNVADFGSGGKELTPVEINLEFSLSVGSLQPYKDVENASVGLPSLESERSDIDLDLSLSIGHLESDITTQISSPVQKRPRSTLVQPVDESLTSSEWTGPFLPLLSGLQNGQSGFINFGNDAVDGVSSTLQYSLMSPNSSIGATSHWKQRRKSVVKFCQHHGCLKGARGASGRCISHGGGRRCEYPRCGKGAEGKTGKCKAHGGGRRCQFEGCSKSAEGRTNLCISHGGGRRCGFLGGCPHAARGNTVFCIRHGGGPRCRVENCDKGADGKASLCIAHGGGRRCQYPECGKGAQGSTKFCKAHGGGKRCTFQGCTKGAEGSTSLCKGHGGGKRCSFIGEEGACTKCVHGGTLYCVAHGGGKRCATPGCKSSARGRTDHCVRHGGGKRCKHDGCNKSAQGKTQFCKAHGGRKQCLWGQMGSGFGEHGAIPCGKSATGKLGICTAHAAQVQDQRVHGNGTVGMVVNDPNIHENMKGIAVETTVPIGIVDVTGEGSTSFTSTQILPNGLNPFGQAGWLQTSLAEGRVHGGGLMALLRTHVKFGSTTANSMASGSSEVQNLRAHGRR